jgi:hypothetical protein
MQHKLLYYGNLFFMACILCAGCKEAVVDYQANECKALPPFIKKIGFNPATSAFSTSEKRIKGLALVQYNTPGDTTNGGGKIYQHESWKQAGYLGPTLLGPQGHCFAGPVPVINLLDNEPAKQNIVYMVDANTGVMNKFIELPLPDSIYNTNPYGILGFTYLCEADVLYISTVAGSNRQTQNGVVYAVSAITGQIIDKLENTDVMGMGISYLPGKRTLYCGSARSSDVYVVSIDKDGRFTGKLNFAFSVAGIGPRGDDKIRRIRFDKTGNMLLHAIEFNFNLTAPTEKQESIYTFQYDEATKNWIALK